jgi:hypothetical protein
MKQVKIIIFSAFFTYSTAQAIHTTWYLDVIQETSLSYQNKCKLIGIAQALKHGFAFAKHVLSTKTYNNINKEIAQQRLHIKNVYLTKEKQILERLGITMGFLQQQWACCLHAIDEIKKIARETVRQPSDNIQQEQTISKKLKTLLYHLLQKNTINPHAIKLCFKKTEEPYTFAITSTNLALSYDDENIALLQQPFISQKVIIYEHISQESTAHQLAFLAHEVEHLCQQHNITTLVIENYVQNHHIQLDALEKNNEFQHLLIIHEEQAEIFAALKDSKVAQALVDLRAIAFYPNHLYEAHYHDLVEINNLWKVEKLVDKIKRL